MTADEAASFAAKLALVWEVETHDHHQNGGFEWRGETDSCAVVVGWAYDHTPSARWYAKTFCISCGSGPVTGIYMNTSDSGHEQEQQQFIPIFRRNCWLSGCEVECSAHERVEWDLWFREKSTTSAYRSKTIALLLAIE